MKTSRVVQHIGEAVQAQACPTLQALSSQSNDARASQVNLAKLDAYARMEGNSNQGKQRLSKKVMSVQASNILAARAKLEDAMWEPWLRAKVLHPAECSRYARADKRLDYADRGFAAAPRDGDRAGQGAWEGTCRAGLRFARQPLLSSRTDTW